MLLIPLVILNIYISCFNHRQDDFFQYVGFRMFNDSRFNDEPTTSKHKAKFKLLSRGIQVDSISQASRYMYKVLPTALY